jgi:hypothetical protein
MPDNERSPEPTEARIAREDNEVEGHTMEPGGKRDAELNEEPEVEGHAFSAERKPWETQKKG